MMIHNDVCIGILSPAVPITVEEVSVSPESTEGVPLISETQMKSQKEVSVSDESSLGILVNESKLAQIQQ